MTFKLFAIDYPTGWFTSISVLTTYCYKAQQWTGCMCVTARALIVKTVRKCLQLHSILISC